MSTPEKRLKTKIWFILVISVVITTGAVSWSIRSFNELENSVYELSQPNAKLVLINDINQNFQLAESHIQRYMLEGNPAANHQYKEKIALTQLQIQELKDLIKFDSSQVNRLDSLNVIFQEKVKYLNRFLVLKQQQEATAYTQLALTKIEENTNDTSTTETEIYEYTNTIRESRPILRQEIVPKKEKPKGFWGAIKKVFTNEKPSFDTLEYLDQDYFTYIDTKVDTNVVKSYNPDTILLKVKEILSETKNLEVEMQNRLNYRELRVLKQDQIFMNKMQSIINDLKESERIASAQKKDKASGKIASASRVITFIGIGGLIAGGILLVLITKDMTRTSYYRKKLEKEKLKAEKLSMAKETFLATMSHEIRNPLNSILGFTKLLDNGQLGSDQKEYMRALVGSSSYLMKLVNDILDYSKVEAGELQLVKEAFSVKSLVVDTNAMFSMAAKEKELDFSITIKDEVPEWLSGDAFRIKQIINNLISNAIKFTSSGSIKVTLGGWWYRECFYLETKVKDTGIGIDEEKLVEVFESFKQESADISGKFGGTGLGLSISKQLTEAMDGTIHVESTKGKGTCFTVKLPLSKAVSILEEDNVIQEDFFYDATIVIVEDDKWNALLLATLLKRKAELVHSFRNAKDAIEYLLENKDKVDLIFTDLNMPEMSGQNFAKACRSNGYEKPIVAVTAWKDVTLEKDLAMCGINELCKKPYDKEKIDLLLSRFLSGKEMNPPLMEEADDTISYAIDLTDIKLFSGNNKTEVGILLDELHKNSRAQFEVFQQLTKEKNWKKLSELAHQMVSAFDHIRLFQASELLKSIELYEKTGNYQRVEELSVEACNELAHCIAAIEETKDQYCIV